VDTNGGRADALERESGSAGVTDGEHEQLAAFGRFVRGMRQAVALTQQQLAERMGVARTWVTQVEAGQLAPSFANYVRLLRALDAPWLDPTQVSPPGTPEFQATARALGLVEWLRSLNPGERVLAMARAYEAVEVARMLPDHWTRKRGAVARALEPEED
jgi:transcriptional regulator with XRE-family HTH domain